MSAIFEGPLHRAMDSQNTRHYNFSPDFSDLLKTEKADGQDECAS